MKKLHVDKDGDTNQYLIERAGELAEAVDHFKSRADLGYLEAAVILAGSHSWLMNPIPTTYPYVVVMDADDERNAITLTFVKPSAFAAEPDDKEHLFEFNIRRSGLNIPYQIRESKYQIPARDIFEAHLALGQNFHDDGAYLLEVLSWVMVH